jgi:hypothetical protein
MTSIDVAPARSGIATPTVVDDPVRRAVAAYLSRFKDRSQVHNESDLRAFLLWCEEQQFAPLQATRPHLELYLR